jgi:hypothetical protein
MHHLVFLVFRAPNVEHPYAQHALSGMGMTSSRTPTRMPTTRHSEERSDEESLFFFD